MQRVLFILLACCVWCSSRVAAAEHRIVGTWVYVEHWQAAPKYRPGMYSSRAIVLRFCANGRFTMLKCVLYRQRHEYTGIGPSDGLEIYQGTWSSSHHGATVSYHLAEAEITFTGYEDARKQQLTAAATLTRNELQMPVARLFPSPTKEFTMRFQQKKKLPAPLQEKFIDCDAKG